ncbi:INAR1 protein, partial [Pitta sordida]|nr:INAR1 protein [Pitta sordida]
GQGALQSPQDLQVLVVNTNVTLSWSYPGGDPAVTFSAQYNWSEQGGAEWQEVPGCRNVPGRGCDLSWAITEFYDVHHVRVRAERRGQVSPWSRALEMIPYDIAQIGPPEIQLQSSNGDIKIHISPPEANQEKRMWINDLNFKYNLVFWENSSDPQLRSRTVFPVDTVDALAPETTYCFKVQANLPTEAKEGLFSPVRCATTTPRVPNLLCATNLRVRALNMKFHLHWDPGAEPPVSSTVQFLPGYLKQLNEDPAGKWLSVPGCANVTGTRCHVSPAITTTGFYYLRVQSRGQGDASCLSGELRVDPLTTNEIGPPGVKLDSSQTLLHVQISPPGGSEEQLMRDNYVFSYRILYWKNSSTDEEETHVKETNQTITMIRDVSPGALYCVRVQALSRVYSKSSAYSQQQCIHTPAEKTYPLIILATFLGGLFVVVLAVSILIFVLYQAYSKIKYVFFPSCQPPLNIEGFGEQLTVNPYLPAAEELVENCSIIESMMTEEGNQIDFRDCKHSKQSNRDSGNYSNDDSNTSGSKGSEGRLDKEI